MPKFPLKSFLIVCGLVLGGLTLLILPADFFDEGPPICLSVVLFDQTCPGCGMTRGCHHLLHMEFAEAFQYNPLAFIVLPILLTAAGYHLYRNSKILYDYFKQRPS